MIKTYAKQKILAITVVLIFILSIWGIIKTVSLYQGSGDEIIEEIDFMEEEFIEIDENDEFFTAGTRADGYYIEQLIVFYPMALERSINDSNLHSLEVFLGNESIPEDHVKLIESLRSMGSNFNDSDLFKQQYIEVKLSYIDKEDFEKEIILTYFLKFDEIRDDHGRGGATIIEMGDVDYSINKSRQLIANSPKFIRGDYDLGN